MPLTNPRITFLIASRNDHYAGNSLWRLQSVLNYLGHAASLLQRPEDVEVIVSDWGSEVPLRDALDLTGEAATICRFLEVPPEVARIEGQGSPFPEVIANNAAARRARGEFIGRIDQDTLVGIEFLQEFFNLIADGRGQEFDRTTSFFFVRRRSVPLAFSGGNFSLDVVRSFVRVWGKWLPREGRGQKPWFDAPVGILLMHRDLWEATRGYDEKLLLWGFMDADLGLRVQSRHQVVALEKWIGCRFYHLRHGKRSLAVTPRKKNPRRRGNAFQPNSEDWGLRDHDLPMERYSSGNENDTRPEIRHEDWGTAAIFLRFGVPVLAEWVWQSFTAALRLVAHVARFEPAELEEMVAVRPRTR